MRKAQLDLRASASHRGLVRHGPGVALALPAERVKSTKIVDASENDSVVKTALSDAMRRGPILAFQLPLGNERVVQGHVARHVVVIRSEEPIPEPARSAFLGFLEGLKFAPYFEIRCVRIIGNDTTPA
jgi:hypothetical protein